MILGKIRVCGVVAKPVSVNPIPRGIVTGQLQFEYDPLWESLAKTVVFRAGNVTKDILNPGELVTIPPEVVAEAGKILRVGVWGEGTPTLWADLGRVRDAADPSGDESTDPTLPVWAQLQEDVEKLKQNSPGGPGEDGDDGGHYVPAVTQPDDNTLEFSFTPSKADMPAVEPVQVELPAGQGSVGNAALTTAQIEALHGMFKVCAYDDSKDVSGAYAAFKTAFGITDSGEEEPDTPVAPDKPEKNLTSISATYSGGDVAVGTAVTALTGIVVTAHYSDGTSEAVTGYTLSGTIAEGNNTVTVSYGGKTTTFTVTGVAESGGEETELTINEGGAAGTFYADEGVTAYTEKVFSSDDGTCWISEKIARVDTEVTIKVLYGSNNGNLVQHAGCVKDMYSTFANYVEKIGSASVSEYSYTYTVKAGYRLGIFNYNGGKPSSITVITNSPDDWEYPANDNLFDGTYMVGMLAGDGSLGSQALKTTDYMDCSGLSELYILQNEKGTRRQYYRCYYFYDSDKAAISGDTTGIAPTTPYESISVPDGATYIRVTQGGAYGTTMLYVGANSLPDYSIFVDWTTDIS